MKKQKLKWDYGYRGSNHKCWFAYTEQYETDYVVEVNKEGNFVAIYNQNHFKLPANLGTAKTLNGAKRSCEQHAKGYE